MDSNGFEGHADGGAEVGTTMPCSALLIDDMARLVPWRHNGRYGGRHDTQV
ncbi:hypothetical protein Scep_023979 [Stephania cephalantha]|uniref:Uncharacterized protein n=1 Tax=Stephania cephalantha TaxID=152367 RepID=A0AAP0EWA4_9MAGN